MVASLIFYNFILLFSTLFVYLSEKVKNRKQELFLLLIAFLIVFLPAAFRYEIGIDYFAYKNIFENIASFENYEIGYVFLNKFIYNIGLSYEWLFAIIAFIIYFCFFISYPKQDRAIFHFLLFSIYYFISFNQLRSALALGFILIAIMSFYKSKNLFFYIVLIFLATMFHKSAILFLLFVPFLNHTSLKVFKKIHILIIVSIVVIYFLKDSIVYMILNNSITDALGFSRYTNHSKYGTETELNTGLGVVIKILILLFPMLFYKKILNGDKDKLIFIYIIFVCLIAVFFASTIDIFSRFERIFIIAYVLAIILVKATKTILFRKTYVLLGLLYFFIIFNKDILNGSTDFKETCGGYRIQPYISIFNKEDSKRVQELTWQKHICERYFNN